jgi:hypothetical protein
MPATNPHTGSAEHRSRRIKAIKPEMIPPIKMTGINNKERNTKLSDSKMQMPARNGAPNENMPNMGARLAGAVVI